MLLQTDDLLAMLDARLERIRTAERLGVDPSLPLPVDWFALFKREGQAEWLVDQIWPSGRQVHLHAARKTGKSLVALWIACNLAVGRDPFTLAPREPVAIGYLDFEMTEDDLLERIEDMGFTAEELAGRLIYFLHPVLPKLDTKAGGERLLETLQAYKVVAVVIDTLSRVVAGEESSNDTYIRFYNHTGVMLKHAGIAMLRLDHEGHESGRSRGASAKADDVDIVWQLALTDDGLVFNRKAARMSWIPERVNIRKHDDPKLSFGMIPHSWPAGTKEKALELDASDVALDATRKQASDALKAHGYVAGRTVVLVAALRFRTQRPLGRL